jgi:hypothetical protein
LVSQLFEDVYVGYALRVSPETDAMIGKLFGRLDRRSMYRAADSYLIDCPPSRKPKNYRRFLINWARKEDARTLKAADAWAEREAVLQRELHRG